MDLLLTQFASCQQRRLILFSFVFRFLRFDSYFILFQLSASFLAVVLMLISVFIMLMWLLIAMLMPVYLPVSGERGCALTRLLSLTSSSFFLCSVSASCFLRPWTPFIRLSPLLQV